MHDGAPLKTLQKEVTTIKYLHLSVAQIFHWKTAVREGVYFAVIYTKEYSVPQKFTFICIYLSPR